MDIPNYSDLQIALFLIALFAAAFVVTALVLAAAVKGTSSVFAFEHPKHLILWSAFVVAVPPAVALMARLVHKARIGEFPQWRVPLLAATLVITVSLLRRHHSQNDRTK